MPLYAKIDVSKVDKSRLFKGEKGTYLDLVLIETPNSKYGSHMIKQSAPKGTDMPILGNVQHPRATTQQSREGFHQARQASDVPPNVGEDDVPF